MNNKRLLKKLHDTYQDNENYYMLRLMISRAVKSRQKVSARIVSVTESALLSHSLRLSEEELTNAILQASHQKPFGEDEILSLHKAVCLALLKLLTQDKNATKEELFLRAENAAFTLRSLEAADWDTRYQTLSSLEQTLRHEDPLYALCDKQTQNDIKGKLLQLAKKHRLPESDAARLFYRQATQAKCYAKQGRFFFIAVYTLSFLATASLFFIGIPILFLPLLWFGVFVLG